MRRGDPACASGVITGPRRDGLSSRGDVHSRSIALQPRRALLDAARGGLGRVRDRAVLRRAARSRSRSSISSSSASRRWRASCSRCRCATSIARSSGQPLRRSSSSACSITCYVIALALRAVINISYQWLVEPDWQFKTLFEIFAGARLDDVSAAVLERAVLRHQVLRVAAEAARGGAALARRSRRRRS